MLIEVRGITKIYKRAVMEKGIAGAVKNFLHTQYEEKTAIDNISFSVDAKESVGYVGSNGSGKSTTIKMLSGILTPTRGEIRIASLIPYKDRIRNNKQIGVIFGQRSQLWWDVPVVESYKLIQKMYEMEHSKYKRNLNECMEILDIGSLLKFAPRQLSLGQKMRCEIGSVILHEPSLLYLDEPTIGLDVYAKDKIRTFIKYVNEEKSTTIFLTSHDFEDIESICKRVIVLEGGRIVWDGYKHQMKAKYAKSRFIKIYLSQMPPQLIEHIKTIDSIILKEVEGNCISMECDMEKYPPVEIINIVEKFAKIQDLEIKAPSIESIIKNNFV